MAAQLVRNRLQGSERRCGQEGDTSKAARDDKCLQGRVTRRAGLGDGDVVKVGVQRGIKRRGSVPAAEDLRDESPRVALLLFGCVLRGALEDSHGKPKGSGDKLCLQELVQAVEACDVWGAIADDKLGAATGEKGDYHFRSFRLGDVTLELDHARKGSHLVKVHGDEDWAVGAGRKR
jgi:hypothetical protein